MENFEEVLKKEGETTIFSPVKFVFNLVALVQ